MRRMWNEYHCDGRECTNHNMYSVHFHNIRGRSCNHQGPRYCFVSFLVYSQDPRVWTKRQNTVDILRVWSFREGVLFSAEGSHVKHEHFFLEYNPFWIQSFWTGLRLPANTQHKKNVRASFVQYILRFISKGHLYVLVCCKCASCGKQFALHCDSAGHMTDFIPMSIVLLRLLV